MSREAGARPIRVVYLTDNAGFGGDERVVLELVSRLPRSRYELAVACSGGGDFVEALHDLGVPVISLDLRVRRRVDVGIALARELRPHRPHIVHTRGRADLSGRLAARLARVPALVCSPRLSGADWRRGLWRKLPHRLRNLTLDRMVDRFIVGNRESGSLLTDQHGVPPERIAVIPEGIEIERYDPSRVGRESRRARFGVPDGVFLVGAVGRLAPEAGFDDLIRAVAGVDRPDVWLVIAGDGPAWEELGGLIEALGLRYRCRLLGHVEDVPGFLADLDLFVSAARGPGHHMALLEAMAMARPVIATDVAGASDVIADGVDGRLVASGDMAGLSDTVLGFVEERDAGTRLGRNARSKVEREFTAERMASRTSLLYEELVAEKRCEG